MYYDKYGKQLELMEWARLLEREEYKRIGKTKLWWGGLVSTVWLGIDYSWYRETPIIFETMIFWKGDGVYMKRYGGLLEARNGHIKTVKEWSNPIKLIIRLIGREE